MNEVYTEKRNRFLLTLVLLLCSRAFDIITTYLYIPDLQGEMNPFASILHFGWPKLLMAQVLLVAVVLYVLYIYYFRKVEIVVRVDTLSLKDFISVYHFGETGKFWNMLYRLPTNRYSLAAFLGSVVSNTLIAVGFLVGTSTTFLIVSTPYRNTYKAYHISWIIILSMFVIAYGFTLDFYRSERRKRIIGISDREKGKI